MLQETLNGQVLPPPPPPSFRSPSAANSILPRRPIKLGFSLLFPFFLFFFLFDSSGRPPTSPSSPPPPPFLFLPANFFTSSVGRFSFFPRKCKGSSFFFSLPEVGEFNPVRNSFLLFTSYVPPHGFLHSPLFGR